MFRYVLSVVISVCLVGCCCGELPDIEAPPKAGTISPTKEKKVDPVVVASKALSEDYDANEVAADQEYKGKVLEVSGKVDSIDKDFLDNIIVRLKGKTAFQNVMATMKSSEKSEAAGLSKGQQVTVRCTGSGSVMGSPSLRECVFK